MTRPELVAELPQDRLAARCKTRRDRVERDRRRAVTRPWPRLVTPSVRPRRPRCQVLP